MKIKKHSKSIKLHQKSIDPNSSMMDLQTVPPDLLVKGQPVFYADSIDAVFKALGVN